jgi:hypothetical protein
VCLVNCLQPSFSPTRKERTSSGEIDSGSRSENWSRNFDRMDPYDRFVFFLGVQPMVIQVKVNCFGYFHFAPPGFDCILSMRIAKLYQIFSKKLRYVFVVASYSLTMKRNGMTAFKEYLSIRNLCYHFSQEVICLQNKTPFGVNLVESYPPNPF